MKRYPSLLKGLTVFKVPENCRVTVGGLATRPHEGLYGAFLLENRITGRKLLVVASDGSYWKEAGMPGSVAWEHVSVSIVGKPGHCPNWPEMAGVKDLFWGEEDCVMQLHPPASEYVNYHRGTLHLWRPIGVEIPRPPSICVGPK